MRSKSRPARSRGTGCWPARPWGQAAGWPGPGARLVAGQVLGAGCWPARPWDQTAGSHSASCVALTICNGSSTLISIIFFFYIFLCLPLVNGVWGLTDRYYKSNSTYNPALTWCYIFTVDDAVVLKSVQSEHMEASDTSTKLSQHTHTHTTLMCVFIQFIYLLFTYYCILYSSVNQTLSVEEVENSKQAKVDISQVLCF